MQDCGARFDEIGCLDTVDKRCVLVAGPSGGGKSTFIRALTDGRLDPSIVATLPDGCERWRVVEANNFLKDRLSAAPVAPRSPAVGAVIYHYDITFIHRVAIDTYEEDPFCSALKGVGTLNVIYVRPDLVSLLEQFRSRKRDRRAARGWIRRAWHSGVRQPLRRIELRNKGLPVLDADDLYCLPGFLNSCYRRWERFLKDVAAANPQLRLLVVHPQRDSSGNPAFVVDRPNTVAAMPIGRVVVS